MNNFYPCMMVEVERTLKVSKMSKSSETLDWCTTFDGLKIMLALNFECFSWLKVGEQNIMI